MCSPESFRVFTCQIVLLASETRPRSGVPMVYRLATFVVVLCASQAAGAC